MKKSCASLFLLTGLIAICLLAPVAVSCKEKTDSICHLVQRYLTNKRYDSLYHLTGKTFRSRIGQQTFERIAQVEFAPLGKLEKTIFIEFTAGAAWYRAEFEHSERTLIIALDREDKMDFFRLKKGKDDNTFPSRNRMRSAMDTMVDGVARRFMMQLPAVSLSVGILKDGRTYFYGYGETSRGNPTPPQPSTLFEIASVTKTFTATMLAIAVEDRRVQLDDRVNKYLPDSIPSLQFNNKPVTLRQLANHTSAIPFMPANFDSAVVDPVGHPGVHYDLQKFYSFLRKLQLEHEPGTVYRYSNAGYALLAAVLENVYHQSYDQLLTRYITLPLRMKETRTFILDAPAATRASGYGRSGNAVAPWDHRPVLIGHGGLASSAKDMLRYAEAECNKECGTLGKAMQLTHKMTFTAGDVAIGLAWQYIDFGTGKVLHHTGGTAGYTSYFAIDPTRKIGVILLSNSPVALTQDGDYLLKRLQE